ncbi:MAG: hypothetical protein KDJ67_17215, partial [Nitratireductor sp.]|nr:hypothetical protein [Nitratireductor sp.]
FESGPGSQSFQDIEKSERFGDHAWLFASGYSPMTARLVCAILQISTGSEETRKSTEKSGRMAPAFNQ